MSAGSMNSRVHDSEYVQKNGIFSEMKERKKFGNKKVFNQIKQ